MSKKFLHVFILGLGLLLVVGVGIFLVAQKDRADQDITIKKRAVAPAQSPWFSEGTSLLGSENIEVQIQGAGQGGTVKLSWDETKVRIFSIVLLDAQELEKPQGRPGLLSISSLNSPLMNRQEIKKTDVSTFIPSGYTLGDFLPGFNVSAPPSGIQLSVGKTYYLQMIGFTKDDENVFINKAFTFTASCLPPDCK